MKCSSGIEELARPLFVAYYRVSTGRQADSGLGLDAQRSAVRDYVDANRGRLAAEFSENASGRKDNRPQLRKAIGFCRIMLATLAIARLDRLSRNVDLVTRAV
jgi:DNA invertase Pin-like site-specific DNA recombinase